MAKNKVQKPERRAKAPARMNPGETAVLIVLGMVGKEGAPRKELDEIAGNPFTIPSLEMLGFIYVHGKIAILTAKGWGWLRRVTNLIQHNALQLTEEGANNGQEKRDSK